MATSLIELRVHDGPNLYFPHAAVKLTLDLSGLLELPEDDAHALATSLGLRDARPGPAGSAFRQRFAGRAVARLVRNIAAEAGTHRLSVRVRVMPDVRRLVVAYPWRHRRRAEALAHAVAEALDALPVDDADELLQKVSAQVRDADFGSGPRVPRPRIPVVAVTGSRDREITSRLLVHLGRVSGRHVGWSGPEGIIVDGAVVESGDFTGPGGAGRLLVRAEVDLAVTETGHHAIVLGGLGVTHHDVSVVTNVVPGVPGEPQSETLDQLAEVKAVVTRITRSDGWCVLNGDDPRVWSMRAHSSARVWAFSRDADSPALREALDGGGRATSVVEGWICVLDAGQDPDPLIRLSEVPLTAAGAMHAVEVALAATSAALAAGLPRASIVTGLASFTP